MVAFAELGIPNTFYRISVKAAIWQNHTLLLVREHSTHWILPGGGLDHGETLEVGLRRELSEELTISGEIGIAPEPSHIGSGICSGRADMPYRNIPQFFLCYEVEAAGEIAAGPHVKELRWWDRSQFAALPECDETSTINALFAHKG